MELKVTAYCGMHMVNIHHRKIRVNAGLNGLGNYYGKKTMLFIWWDLEVEVYHECLKSSETINSARYHVNLNTHCSSNNHNEPADRKR
ncbi:hypothetical protein AVEN_152293-1 [Araneus ventricosus]|uniref:Uncharacterized protein n=1 Tax=Araneus ventricosus TaxID=182803 RepID=A0A4Y2K8J6_ARAVE|nr:hypothetical protein AVEN_152293-1 [Araneus ventricosus]